MLTEAAALFRELDRWEAPDGIRLRAALAIAQWEQGQTTECRALLEPLLDRARPPSDLPAMARVEILAVMGFVETELGDPAAGEALLREAVDLEPELAEEDRLRLRVMRLQLAESLMRQGRYADVGELLEPLCDELAPLLSHGNTVALDAFNLRGKLRLEQGRLAESAADFEDALSAAEANLGALHPRTLNAHNNLATSYIAMKRWSEAEELLRHAIESSTETHGPDSRETLTALSNMGSVLIGTGRYDEAEELLRSALERELAVYGETDIRAAMARSNLAICLYHLKRYAEAAEEQAIALEFVSPQTAEYPFMERSLGLYRKLAGQK